jgi:hypothetical protein
MSPFSWATLSTIQYYGQKRPTTTFKIGLTQNRHDLQVLIVKTKITVTNIGLDNTKND